jgi:hypothetical protein
MIIFCSSISGNKDQPTEFPVLYRDGRRETSLIRDFSHIFVVHLLATLYITGFVYAQIIFIIDYTHGFLNALEDLK